MIDVQVDEAVFAEIQRDAVPLTDDFNSALRRRLGMNGNRPSDAATRQPTPPSPRSPSGRAAAGTILPESEYELPLLRALVDAGGSGPTAEITDRVGQMLGSRLMPGDYELNRSGERRWRNRTAWTRQRLKERGLLKNDSPRGIWEISDRGRRHLQRNE